MSRVLLLIEELKQSCLESECDSQNEIMERLGHIGEPAVEPLIEVLRGEDEDVRAPAAVALGYIGEPAVEPLIRMLRHGDEDEDIRAIAAIALGNIGGRASKVSD